MVRKTERKDKILDMLRNPRSQGPGSARNYDKRRQIIDHLIQDPKYKKNRPYSPPDRIVEFLRKDYQKREKPVFDISKIDDQYFVSINDTSVVNPFIVSPGLVYIIKQHTDNYQTDREKARALYDWIEQNIDYGRTDRNYSNSKEVIEQKKGICGEMTFVYVTMARSIGFESSFVEVDVDFKGKEVAHACAMVKVSGEEILVDPAYHRYDVQHLDYKVLSDMDVLIRFNQWRDNKVNKKRKSWTIFDLF